MGGMRYKDVMQLEQGGVQPITSGGLYCIASKKFIAEHKGSHL